MSACADGRGWNLATRGHAERTALHVDLIACRIRYQLKGLKGKERQHKGHALLAQVSPSLRDAVLDRLKARASAV